MNHQKPFNTPLLRPCGAPQGQAITRATLTDIRALPVAAGQEWRTEEFGDAVTGAAPYPAVAFDIRDGILRDYTVWVDADGVAGGDGYAVWLRDLLEVQDLQARFGVGSADLRARAVDLDALSQVQFAEPDRYRIEMVGAEQLDFAFRLYGIAFRPELFVANSIATGAQAGMVDYAGGGEGTQVSLDGLVRNYAAVARGLAVRIAVQGPLARYFEGVQYDPASDSFQATSGRELIPLFTHILEDAPAGAAATIASNDNDKDANGEAIDLFCFSFEKQLGAGGRYWAEGIAA